MKKFLKFVECGVGGEVMARIIINSVLDSAVASVEESDTHFKALQHNLIIS